MVESSGPCLTEHAHRGSEGYLADMPSLFLFFLFENEINLLICLWSVSLLFLRLRLPKSKIFIQMSQYTFANDNNFTDYIMMF